jgi:hypothetical protein
MESDKQLSRSKAMLLQAKASEASLGELVHWILRVGAAGCFVGHGAFGLITKPEWLKYFAVVGIGPDLAYRLMPLIGSMDILIGSLILIYPIRALLVWATLWTVWTALLRPLAGEGIWEFLERAGNFGVPFALIYLSGWPRQLKCWFSLAEPLFSLAKAVGLAWVLRVTVFCLSLGHGGFGAFMQKRAWTHYLATLGIAPNDVRTLSPVPIIGWFEIALGLLVLALPSAELLLFVFAWKVFTEMLRPLSGEPPWEFVERFGSYAAPLALFFILLALRSDQKEQNIPG